MKIMCIRKKISEIIMHVLMRHIILWQVDNMATLAISKILRGVLILSRSTKVRERMLEEIRDM